MWDVRRKVWITMEKLVFGLEEEVSVPGNKYYVVASRLLGDEMTVNPIIHSKSERSKVKQA